MCQPEFAYFEQLIRECIAIHQQLRAYATVER